jgi:hypothetical protein
MATFDDVARLALAMPDVIETEAFGHGHNRAWTVSGGKAFAWERSFSKADIRRFGDVKPPDGPILAVRVSSLDEKDVKLMAGTRGVFTIPHFDGYAAILIQLNRVTMRALRDALTDAYLATSPAQPSEKSPRRGSVRPSRTGRSERGGRTPSARPRRRA